MKDIEKLSAGELLLLAITEARKYPPDKLYMGNWIYFKDNKVCTVCLAGAVIVSRHPDITLSGVNAMLYDDDFAVYFYINKLRIGIVDARFLDTPAKIASLKAIEDTGIIRDAYQARAEPWRNKWAAHTAFANELIAAGI